MSLEGPATPDTWAGRAWPAVRRPNPESKLRTPNPRTPNNPPLIKVGQSEFPPSSWQPFPGGSFEKHIPSTPVSESAALLLGYGDARSCACACACAVRPTHTLIFGRVSLLTGIRRVHTISFWTSFLVVVILVVVNLVVTRFSNSRLPTFQQKTASRFLPQNYRCSTTRATP